MLQFEIISTENIRITTTDYNYQTNKKAGNAKEKDACAGKPNLHVCVTLYKSDMTQRSSNCAKYGSMQ